MVKNVLAAVAVFLLLGAAAYSSFFIAPTDAKQGLIYRILFLHVASAWTGLTAFFISFIANVLYVLRRQRRWDWLGVASGEVGLAFTTAVLVTGPIWARPVWGIWWTWDARLTTTLIMWLLYVSYLLLRRSSEPGSSSTLATVFALSAAVDIPIVWMAIRWYSVHTQHPQPV